MRVALARTRAGWNHTAPCTAAQVAHIKRSCQAVGVSHKPLCGYRAYGDRACAEHAFADGMRRDNLQLGSCRAIERA